MACLCLRPATPATSTGKTDENHRSLRHDQRQVGVLHMGLETVIEADARDYIRALGGDLFKWVSPGNKGVPDRIAAHANCGPFLIEFKAPTKKLDPHQREKCTELAALGFRIYAGENWEGVRSIKTAREIIHDEVRGCPRRHSIVSGL